MPKLNLDRIDNLVGELHQLQFQLLREQMGLEAKDDPNSIIRGALEVAAKRTRDAAVSLAVLPAVINYEMQRAAEQRAKLAAVVGAKQ